MLYWIILEKLKTPPAHGERVLAGSPVGRANREALAPHAVDVVYGAFNGIGGGSPVYQNVDSLDVVGLVTVLRLIQSQTQTGSASSKALKHHPQTLALILFQDIEQLCEGSLCYSHNCLIKY